MEPKLEFATKYDAAHAQVYFLKHHAGLGRKLSHWAEERMVRRALKLAGEPMTVLDIPCGTGRFWPLLVERAGRDVLAADLNLPMLRTGLTHRPADITARIKTFQASAFRIPVADNAVEAVVCIRLVHHLGRKEDRKLLFQELARVASRHVIVSLWIDGNWKAVRCRRKHARRGPRPRANRYLLPRAETEAEFREAGLTLIGRVHLLPYYSMWATYVLQKNAPR